MTDRAVIKLARKEYLRRASLIGEPEGESPTESETPTTMGPTHRRKPRERTAKSIARRQAKRLLARKEEVPVQLLRTGWPEGTSRKPEVQRLLESTGLAASRKTSTVRGRKRR